MEIFIYILSLIGISWIIDKIIFIYNKHISYKMYINYFKDDIDILTNSTSLTIDELDEMYDNLEKGKKLESIHLIKDISIYDINKEKYIKLGGFFKGKDFRDLFFHIENINYVINSELLKIGNSNSKTIFKYRSILDINNDKLIEKKNVLNKKITIFSFITKQNI